MERTVRWNRLLILCAMIVAAACQAAAPAPTRPPAKPVAAPAEKPAASPVVAPGAKAAPSPAAKPAADWRAEWERTVAAAKQEGRVVVAGLTGDTRRKVLTAFQETYPEIQVEYTGLTGREITPRILAERQGGQFLWDVIISGTNSGLNEYLPAGVLDPLRPMLIRPQVYDDSKWFGGFDWGFVETARQRVFASGAYQQHMVRINRDFLPEGEITQVDDLLDPKYKGKIVWDDPRFPGTGNTYAARFLASKGEDWIRKLIQQQSVVVTRDKRQIVEWAIRGRHPIIIAVDDTTLQEFQREGVGNNIRRLDTPEAVAIATYPGIFAVNRAAHPNAAKLYLDWFLSEQGQALWNKSLAPFNSRRLDVEPAERDTLLKPGEDYFIVSREENQHFIDRANDLVKEVLP